MAIRDDASSQGWELEETGDVGDRWVLEESEQQLADEWDLEGTPEPVGQWQPVEYDKPRRGGPAWILPTLVTLALLAVLGYSAYTLVPDIVATMKAGAIGFAMGQRGQSVEPEPEQLVGVPIVEPIATDTPTVEPTATPPPLEAPAQPLLLSPTEEQATPIAQKLFATVLTELGVNARSEPNVNSEVIEILAEDETFVVLNKVDDEWLQLFVAEGPLTTGDPIDGYVGYAAAEFFAEGMRPLPDDIWINVLASAGTPATPTPSPIPPTPTPTEPPPALELPTVTPIPPIELAEPTPEPTTEPTADSAAEFTTVPVSTRSEGPVDVVVDAVSGLKVRTQPALESDVVALLPDKTELTAIGRYATNDWILIDLGDGATGWVYKDLVRVDGDLTSLPAITLGELPPPSPTPTETATPEPSATPAPVEPPAPYTSELPAGVPGAVVFSALGVNARQAPEAGASVITILPENAALPVVGRTADGNWLQVDLPNGGLAWVFRATIIPRGNVNAVTVKDGSEVALQPTASPEPETSPTEAPATDETEEPVVESEPTTVPDEESASSVTAIARQVVVPVFAVADTDGERIVQFGRGTQLPAIGQSADGEWIQVRTPDGQIGWVTVKSVDLTEEISVLPVVE